MLTLYVQARMTIRFTYSRTYHPDVYKSENGCVRQATVGESSVVRIRSWGEMLVRGGLKCKLDYKTIEGEYRGRHELSRADCVSFLFMHKITQQFVLVVGLYLY